MSQELFKALDIARPVCPIPPFSLQLVRSGLLTAEDARNQSRGSLLWRYLSALTDTFKQPTVYKPSLAANQGLLNREMNIDIAHPELTDRIRSLYDGIDIKSRLASKKRPGKREMAIIALKLGLDFAQGNHPKIHFGDDPREFIPVPLHHQPTDRIPQTESTIGRIVEIFEEAQDQGHDIHDLITALTQLAPHIWRSSVKQALANAKGSLGMLGTGIRLVIPGTSTPITKAEELRAVEAHIRNARRRIGALVDDLQAEFESMAGQGTTR